MVTDDLIRRRLDEVVRALAAYRQIPMAGRRSARPLLAYTDDPWATIYLEVEPTRAHLILGPRATDEVLDAVVERGTPIIPPATHLDCCPRGVLRLRYDLTNSGGHDGREESHD